MLWEKVIINIIYMLMNQGKHYIIKAWDDLSGWLKARALVKTNSMSITKFIYKNIIMCYIYLMRIVINKELENKNIIIKLLKRYKIA